MGVLCEAILVHKTFFSSRIPPVFSFFFAKQQQKHIATWIEMKPKTDDSFGFSLDDFKTPKQTPKETKNERPVKGHQKHFKQPSKT